MAVWYWNLRIIAESFTVPTLIIGRMAKSLLKDNMWMASSMVLGVFTTKMVHWVRSFNSIRARRYLGKSGGPEAGGARKGPEKSAMLQWDEPESTDGVHHRPTTASCKSLRVPYSSSRACLSRGIDHRLAILVNQGSDPTVPYQALVIRESAMLFLGFTPWCR